MPSRVRTCTLKLEPTHIGCPTQQLEPSLGGQSKRFLSGGAIVTAKNTIVGPMRTDHSRSRRVERVKCLSKHPSVLVVVLTLMVVLVWCWCWWCWRRIFETMQPKGAVNGAVASHRVVGRRTRFTPLGSPWEERVASKARWIRCPTK